MNTSFRFAVALIALFGFLSSLAGPLWASDFCMGTDLMRSAATSSSYSEKCDSSHTSHESSHQDQGETGTTAPCSGFAMTSASLQLLPATEMSQVEALILESKEAYIDTTGLSDQTSDSPRDKPPRR